MKKLILSLAIIALGVQGNSQMLTPQLAAQFQNTLDSMRSVLNVKGLGGAVQLPSGEIWSGGAGVSTNIPLDEITPNHTFNIGSVTKTLTAACVLRLVDEGLLSLSDSLHQWLDTFPHINPNITIRQLLRHQSGLFDVIGHPDYQPTVWGNPDSIWAYKDVITTFIKAPVFQPGANWGYSNTNYILLGMIIEAATGATYHTTMQDEFINPVLLNSVFLPPYDPFTANEAHIWLDLNNDGAIDDANNLFVNGKAWYSSAAPAGSYYSTPADMTRWMRALMRGELLSPAMMTELKTTVNTSFPAGTKYGLGIMERTLNNFKAWGHGGDAGYSASVWYVPEKEVSIAVLNNDGRKTSWQIFPVVSALMKTFTTYTSAVGTADLAVEALDCATWPNPFTNQLTVSAIFPEVVEVAEFSLFDESGALVWTGVCPGEAGEKTSFTLRNLEILPAGHYFLQAKSNGKRWKLEEVLVKIN